MRTAGKSFLLALAIGVAAWGSTQVYAGYCVPSGFSGLLTSLVTMDSSPCRALFMLISHTHTLYAGMMTAVLVGIIAAGTECLQSWGAPEDVCKCSPLDTKAKVT